MLEVIDPSQSYPTPNSQQPPTLNVIIPNELTQRVANEDLVTFVGTLMFQPSPSGCALQPIVFVSFFVESPQLDIQLWERALFIRRKMIRDMQ